VTKVDSKIEAIVFDMDGVIVDSEPIWQEARVDLVREHGGAWTDTDGDATRGLGSAVWAARIAEHLDETVTPDEVFAEVLRRMISSYRERLPLFPGAVEAIERLAGDYTVAVASGSPNVLIDVVLSESGLDRVCSAVGYGDEMPRGKPAPDIYLDVLRRIDVPASRAVGVEDSESGLVAVQSAGMYSVAVVSPGYVLSPEVIAGTSLQIGGLDELTVSLIEAIGT
jgi:HAD superfamily hydrolase (TIGR01509 family)